MAGRGAAVGLSDMVARSATRHAHALVVEVPGWWRTRAAVEHAVLGHGWNLAFAPADADVLVVCGEPGPRLAGAFEQVWHQMPGPRVRVDVRAYDDVATCLDEAYRRLIDTDHHRHDAQHRPAASDLLADEGEEDGDGGGHEGMDHGGGHEGMDHGDMDMSPGGIPLAEGGEDRDGLEMDVLHVRLGPVLPHWPAGLVLRCSLQGDVVTEAQAELLDGEHPRDDHGAPLGRRLDNIASLLALAGWGAAAAEARSIRDVAPESGGKRSTIRLERLCREVRRSRTLRWSLRGVGPLSEEDVHRLGLPTDTVGDTYDRLIGMLERATDDGAEAVHDAATSTHHPDRTLGPDRLGHLVTGLDLATARLVVASLDLGDLRAGQAEHEMAHD
jgi:hypothetical protein